jgi:hypothetical protein
VLHSSLCLFPFLFRLPLFCYTLPSPPHLAFFVSFLLIFNNTRRIFSWWKKAQKEFLSVYKLSLSSCRLLCRNYFS